MSVSGDAVWEVLRQDPLFLEQVDEKSRPLFEPLVKEFPDALGDLLDELVTIATLFRAKVLFLGLCLEGGFVEQRTALLGYGRNETVAMVAKTQIKKLQYSLSLAAANVVLFLASMGFESEEEALVSLARLSSEEREEYRAGTLTIGDLLLSQPTIFVND